LLHFPFIPAQKCSPPNLLVTITLLAANEVASVHQVAAKTPIGHYIKELET